MAEPFKNMLNKEVITGMAHHFKRHWWGFDDKKFIAHASRGLQGLELKERNDRIVEAMAAYLPNDFKKAGEILLASLGQPLGEDLSAGKIDKHGIAGWAVTPMTYYVGLYGHKHFSLPMRLLKEMTRRASSEFGLRYFLVESREKTLAKLKTWSKDKNHHVRRLVSEGSRPRLPWAMKLSSFVDDPTPVITLLESLKNDPSEYVRRSVANSLNDIAKDHPDLVAEIAAKWLIGASVERQKLVRHACRTLVKQGHKKTLKVLGFEKPKIKQANIKILTPRVKLGDNLQFTFSVRSASNKEQSLMVDYIIHHEKPMAARHRRYLSGKQ